MDDGTAIAQKHSEPSGDGVGTPSAGGKKYTASIHVAPGPHVPVQLAASIHALEEKLGVPVWALIHEAQHTPYGFIDDALVQQFYSQKGDLPSGAGVALLVDSLGGLARSAYLIARMFRRECSELTVLVPRYAKSAATLLVLGGHEFILGGRGELGPLDAQYYDPDREEFASALDEVQALQRLHARALEAVDETMGMLLMRAPKRVDTLLPHALTFVSSMMRPLLEKIDAVHYTQMSRVLKVAEEYAVRLLVSKYSQDEAEKIARKLVGAYPEHAFVIDTEEARNIGLRPLTPSTDVASVLDTVACHVSGQTVLGRLVEIPSDD